VNREAEMNSTQSINLETKPFLIITGMHRSGTSFLARALNLSGVYLGNLDSIITHDLAPHKDNLRGHWENTKILHLSEETLEFSNGSWDNIPPKIEINEEIRKEIKESVEELTNYPSLMSGFKDPRILLCLEAWRPYLPKELMIIGIFRHPLKVAESLKKRNSLSFQKSMDLWKTYNLKLLKYLEEYNGFLLNFDWPKEKILSELNQIFDKLGLSSSIDLLEWYTEELISSDERQNSSFELPNDVNGIYTKLLDRSQENLLIEITKPKLSENELKLTIDGLLKELQDLGIYFKKINDENVTRVRFFTEKQDPLSRLFSIYFRRNDLRETYPEVMKGDLSGLIKWVKDECLNGPDRMRKELDPFKEFYINFNQNLLENYEFKNKIEKLESEVNLLKQSTDKKEKELNKIKIENVFLKKELEKIQNSFTWKVLRRYDGLRGKK